MNTLQRGTALVRRWSPKFGLADFRITVQPIDTDNPEAHARSFYDIEERWGVIELPPDDYFPPGTQELLVLHELAHGLLQVAAASEHHTVEVACNHIARLAKGDWKTPLFNEHQASVVGDAWYDGEVENDKKAATSLDRRKWLPLIADALPEPERVVIALLYWAGLSMRQAAGVLGVDVHTVSRRRDAALERLRRYYDAAEKEFG